MWRERWLGGEDSGFCLKGPRCKWASSPLQEDLGSVQGTR